MAETKDQVGACPACGLQPQSAKSCCVREDDLFVSRYHAGITFEGDHFSLIDLGSTNGTLLNGKPLKRRELLALDDKIKIGETEMTFILLGKTGSGS